MACEITILGDVMTFGSLEYWKMINKMRPVLLAGTREESYLMRELLADPYEHYRWADDGGMNNKELPSYTLRIVMPDARWPMW